MKQCYYQLLQVDRKASPAQIKTNYRKLALKYHPDKNPTEDTRHKFLLINQAYQVLSDPNQRTWYDNNRQKILFNKDDMTKQDLQSYSFGFNIWNYFTSACFKNYNDQQGGFYQVYRDVFEKIKTQESKYFSMREDVNTDMRKYQGFGDSKTITKKLLQFYDDWQNFTTYKTFIWVDEWDTRQAQNRWVKREMQKQNKKQRQKQKKTYIKTIKDLIQFLKKRDPRYKQYLTQQKKKQQQQQLLNKQKLQSKKKQKQSLKNIKIQLQQQKFKQIQQYYQQQNLQNNHHHHHQHHHAQSDQQSDQQQFYCPICQKYFKSQNQLINHQNSKIHKNTLKSLQKQVMSKQQQLEQATKKQVNIPNENQASKKNKKKKNKNTNNDNNNNNNNIKQQSQKQKQLQQQQPIKKPLKKQLNQPQQKFKQQPQQKSIKNNQKNIKYKTNKDNQSQPQQKTHQNIKQNLKQLNNLKKQSSNINQKFNHQSDSDDLDAQILLNNRKNKQKPSNHRQQPQTQPKLSTKQPTKQPTKSKKPQLPSDNSQNSDDQQQKKKGKAKLKKQKRTNKKQQPGFKCNVCSQSFPSKTKLFDHINKLGHAKAK